MEISNEGNKLVIELDSKIDANTAPALEKNIMPFIESDTEVIFDFGAVTYISSMGLRVLMSVKKKASKGSVKLINVNDVVFDILTTTGFDSILDIVKADGESIVNDKDYRTVTIDDCECIGRGSYFNIYKLDDERAIKVYSKETSLAEIQKEQAVSKSGYVNGLPTTLTFEIVKCEGKFGLIVELIEAKNLMEYLKAHPGKIEEYAKKLSALCRKMHHIKADKNIHDSYKEKMSRMIDNSKFKFSSDEIAKMHEMIESIPYADTIIHSDLGLDDVIVLNGELMLNNLSDLGYGHPIFAIAGIYSSLMTRNNENILSKAEATKVWKAFIREYAGENEKLYEKCCEGSALLKEATDDEEKESTLFKLTFLTSVNGYIKAFGKL